MRGRDVIGLVMIGVVLTLAVGGYVWWEFAGSENSKKQARSASQAATHNQAVAANNTAQLQQANSQLQVKGLNTVTGDRNPQAQSTPVAAQQPALPSPADFQQYEEHADSENVLYVDEVVGTGDEATTGAQVAMVYKGWLTDGQLFDQTRPGEDGVTQPFVFQLGQGQVIQGWDQGIVGMKVGGKRRLVIPSAGGYGPEGQGPIPPNAMLIFDVELIAIAPE